MPTKVARVHAKEMVPGAATTVLPHHSSGSHGSVSVTLPLPLLLAMPKTAGGQLVAESYCTVPCCHGECVATNEATATPGWSLYPMLEVHLPVQGLEVGPQASASGKSSSEYRVLRRRNFSEIALWKSITM